MKETSAREIHRSQATTTLAFVDYCILFESDIHADGDFVSEEAFGEVHRTLWIARQVLLACLHSNDTSMVVEIELPYSESALLGYYNCFANELKVVFDPDCD